jgi:hypothetical protein
MLVLDFGTLKSNYGASLFVNNVELSAEDISFQS